MNVTDSDVFIDPDNNVELVTVSKNVTNFDTTNLTNTTTLIRNDGGDLDDVNIIFVLFKAIFISFIILSAILGNMLVIVSVMRNRRLRWVDLAK